MTYGLTYHWDNSLTASYIGTDDYQEALRHLERLSGDPHVHDLKFLETRTVTEYVL